jgi:hypothetical protein
MEATLMIKVDNKIVMNRVFDSVEDAEDHWDMHFQPWSRTAGTTGLITADHGKVRIELPRQEKERWHRELEELVGHEMEIVATVRLPRPRW